MTCGKKAQKTINFNIIPVSKQAHWNEI